VLCAAVNNKNVRDSNKQRLAHDSQARITIERRLLLTCFLFSIVLSRSTLRAAKHQQERLSNEKLKSTG
jgi:hypothetical protein